MPEQFGAMNQKGYVAKIENFFIFNARYNLTAKEQKVILFLISQIDPLTQKRLHEQVIPMRKIKELFNSSGGSFYDEMQAFSDRITQKHIKFDSGLEYEGRKLPGRINWFQSIIPVKNESGELSLEFLFSEKLTPFLVALKEYAQIDWEETLPLESGFSVRMFQVFRAYRDRMAGYEQVSKLRYELEEFRELLGVGDKYNDWRNFKRRVVDTLLREINETSIWVKVKEQRKGRKVTGLEFSFGDKVKREKRLSISLFNPPAFSRSQTFAIEKLVAYGVREEIAEKMILKVQGGEINGFEDWYFDFVVKLFESKTNQPEGPARAGTLVKWFIDLKVFEQGDHFSTIMEWMSARKKKLQKDNPEAWENRLAARDMSNEEFVKSLSN